MADTSSLEKPTDSPANGTCSECVPIIFDKEHFLTSSSEIGSYVKHIDLKIGVNSAGYCEFRWTLMPGRFVLIEQDAVAVIWWVVGGLLETADQAIFKGSRSQAVFIQGSNRQVISDSNELLKGVTTFFSASSLINLMASSTGSEACSTRTSAGVSRTKA